jgi:hypothetical protein
LHRLWRRGWNFYWPRLDATSTAAPIPTPTPTPSAGSNVQPINVNLGPAGNHPNGVFTSVTVCVPGTSNCQTIDSILVDTGSYGLRILGSELTVSLPGQTQAGNPVAECAQFTDSYTWGPVASADVEIAGDIANDMPLQIIGAPGFNAPPIDCTNTGLPAADSLAALGAKGILGVGTFIQDCGSGCASSGSSNPGIYFACSSSACSVATESLEAQVQNPVPLFSSDNNGVMVSLPAIGAGGAATVSGSLVFGIGTHSDNALGSATVYTTDSLGNFTTSYQGTSYGDSFIDSGSNGIFFLSSESTGIEECSDERGFYCPSKTLTLSAENIGTNGQSGSVPFDIANADTLFSTSNAAFDDLGGTNPGSFDWGLPFFFGRNLFVAIDGQETPGGPGPYWAY